MDPDPRGPKHVDPVDPDNMYIFFKSKVAIYLCIGPLKGRPSYRRSIQLSKEKIQHFKK
jgi:hypothetical protein